MHLRLRNLVRGAALLGPLFALAPFAACASDNEEASADAGTNDASSDVAAKTDARSDTGIDAGPARNPDAWCAALGKKQDSCDNERECGLDFATWCPKQAATNSYAFEKADTACVASSCDVTARSTCRYGKYAEADLDDAQKAFANAYCQTCSPSGVDACVRALYTYDASVGAAVSDAYVAVWELSDPIVNEIKQRCTGTALTPGNNCAKAFGGCAADIYLDALPACK